jgi:hypothetical protein
MTEKRRIAAKIVKLSTVGGELEMNMNRQEIKDGNGYTILGYIETMPDGRVSKNGSEPEIRAPMPC